MKQKQLFPTLLSILFLALCWQLISQFIGLPAIFPSLTDLIVQIILLFSKSSLYFNLAFTILRGLIGILIALSFAALFASIAAFYPFWKAFFHPILVVVRSIPVISLVLIALLWFAPPQLPVFIAIVTMFPILYQSFLTGLEQIEHRWIEMANIFGKKPLERFFTIHLPASKNAIFDGISTSMGFGWRAIIIGEVLAQPFRGIGTAMKHAQAFINVPELIAWTIIAVALSYSFELIIKKIATLHRKHYKNKTPINRFILNNQISNKKVIGIENLTKNFNYKRVINSLTVTFDSDVVSLIKGPSGKGKTTLLRLLAHLELPDDGTISIKDKFTVAYSFQDVRLLPWLTVYENIAYGCSKNNSANEIVNFLLQRMELMDYANSFPHELSGGQRQRIGLARALAAQADILLLDEPLTGLDDELKVKITDLLSEYISAYQPIVVWATHQHIQLKYTPTKEVFI